MMSIPPVCSMCKVFLRCHKNGRAVETFSGADEPYQIWHGDEWVCPECGWKVVVGWGHQPISDFGTDEHYATVKAYEQEHDNLIQVRR